MDAGGTSMMNGKLPFEQIDAKAAREMPFQFGACPSSEAEEKMKSAAEDQGQREREAAARQEAARAAIRGVVDETLAAHLRLFAVPAGITLLAVVIAVVAVASRK